jgi:hypothetical protein
VDNWHYIVLRLAEKFHVMAWNQRNHGQRHAARK